MASSESDGLQYSYRLVVVVDDGSVIGLTRDYSGIHDQRLDQIVNRIREYPGHLLP